MSRLLLPGLAVGFVAACVEPPAPGSHPDPAATATTTADLIGGDEFKDPSRVVVIDFGFIGIPGGCTGVLLTPSHVLTSGHCFPLGEIPSGTVVHHSTRDPEGKTKVEDAIPLTAVPAPGMSARTDPTAPGPVYFHDFAVVTLDHALTPPAGAKEAYLDDTTAAVGGSVFCVGAGSIVDATTIGVGSLHSATFTIKELTDEYATVPATDALSIAGGDSGGPCWTPGGRILGLMEGHHDGRRVGWISRPNTADAKWIAGIAFATGIFDPTSLPLPTTIAPTQWRAAKLDGTTKSQIVAISNTAIEIVNGGRSTSSSLLDLTSSAVNLTSAGIPLATDATAFVDVTGDGLTDLVVPTNSAVDVLVASGGTAFGSRKNTPLGSSGWTTGAVRFGDLDGANGKDYIWVDGTGIWAGLSDGAGKFGTASGGVIESRATWSLSGTFSVAPFDPTFGADVGQIGSTDINTYLSLAGTSVASIGLNSPIKAPGASWADYSAFLPTTKHATYDWVAIRNNQLVVQINNGFGQFPSIVNSPIELGAGWEHNSKLVDLNKDGSADWVGIDDVNIYIKPGLGDGSFGRLKVAPHHLVPAPSIGQLRFADLDGDGFLDVAVVDQPVAGTLTVLPFKATSASVVFSSLSSDAGWSWADLLAGMTKVADWRLPSASELCTVLVTCGDTAGASGLRKINGGGLLSTLQISTQTAPRVTRLADGLPRNGQWRWTPDYALRATADLDGDGTGELVFTSTSGLVVARQLADGLGLTDAIPTGGSVGNVTIDAATQLTGAGDTDHDGREELLIQGTGGSVVAQLVNGSLASRWSIPDPTTSRADSATVAQQEQHGYPALAVVPGSHVRAVMTGTGDADLYLRFGAAPTLTTFDCRPYTSTANETCDLVVPQGVTTAQLMVVGYTQASYQLDVTYTPAEGVVAPIGDLDRDGYADLAVASPHGWTVYRGSAQGPIASFTAPAVLGDRLIGGDSGVLVGRRDGLYRLTAQATTRLMPWGAIDPAAPLLVLGDLAGDGQTELAAIVQGALAIVRPSANGPATLASQTVPQGAQLIAAGELDDQAGPELVVAGPSQLTVVGTIGTQLATRATAQLGVTPHQVATASVGSVLPRGGGRRRVVLQLTSLIAPQ